MALNNNGNGSTSTRLIKNTKGIQLYNPDSQLGSTITLDHWQNFAAIKINPLLPKEQRTPKSVYDYQNGLSILLPIEKIIELKEAAKYVAFEILNGNFNFRRAGVTTAKNDNIFHFVPLSFITENEDDEGLAVQICTNIKQDGTSDNVINFILCKGSYIMDYDPKNGNYEKSADIQTQFLTILAYLNNVESALTMSIAHSIEYEELYRQNYISKSLSELKNKLGITGNNNRNYNNNNNYFNDSNNFGSNNFTPSNNIINGGEISGGDRLTLDTLPMN